MTSHIVSRPPSYQSNRYRPRKQGWQVWLRWLGLGFMWTILGFALLGMFVSGPLGQGNIHNNDSTVAVEFFRLERVGAPGYTRVFVDPSLSQQGHTSIKLNSDFLANVELIAVEPMPSKVVPGPQISEFIFDTKSGGSNKFVAEFLYEGKKQGSVPITIGVNEKSPIDFRLFFLP